MSTTGMWSGTRRCAVLGDPISHSLSPVLHRAGYAALGLGWSYEAHRVPAGGLADFLGDCRNGPTGPDAAWRGLSLTMPLKREAMSLLDSASERALLAGAANTVLLDGDGGATGDNTDVPGALAAIRERHTGPLRSATILGGGATATSVLLALAEAGCRSVVLQVRNPDRVAATLAAAERLGEESPEVAVRPLGDRPTGDILVSTIPAGAQHDDLVARAAGVPVVFEVRYDPWPTPLAAAAAARGQVLVGGLDLLVHQAVRQFELFTGCEAPLAAMRAAGETALQR